MSARFSLGQVVATPGALALLGSSGTDALSLLQRHVIGDWGDVDAQDRRENERSLKNGWLLLSRYGVGEGRKVWIITEADRSSTCILRPEEY